jgi:peroxiredoxin
MRSSIQIGSKAPSFSLIGADGMIHTLIDYRGFKGICFFFFSLKCESSKKIFEDVIKLKENYKNKSIAFVGICIKDPYISFSDSLKGLSELNLGVDLLLEATGNLVDKFGVEVTPHFYIFNQSNLLIYKGLVRDSKINYISLALDQLVGGMVITNPETEALGSSIFEFSSSF